MIPSTLSPADLAVLRAAEERGLLGPDVRLPESVPRLVVVPSRDPLAVRVGTLRVGTRLAPLTGAIGGRLWA